MSAQPVASTRGWQVAALLLAGVVLGQNVERVLASARAAPESTAATPPGAVPAPVEPAPTSAAPSVGSTPASGAATPAQRPGGGTGRAVVYISDATNSYASCRALDAAAARKCCPSGFRLAGWANLGGSTNAACVEER